MDKTHNVDWKILDTKESILYDSVSIKSKQAKLIYGIWSWDSRYPGGVQWLEGGRKGAGGVSEWVVFSPLIVTWSLLEIHQAVHLWFGICMLHFKFTFQKNNTLKKRVARLRGFLYCSYSSAFSTLCQSLSNLLQKVPTEPQTWMNVSFLGTATASY